MVLLEGDMSKPKRKRHYVGILEAKSIGASIYRLWYLSKERAELLNKDGAELGLGRLIGPFRTKGCAKFFIDVAPRNAHIQCVADAERIYRKSKELSLSLARE
jgi:hypothetical protein